MKPRESPTSTQYAEEQPLPDVACSGLLAELRDLQLKAETIRENCRGPGRHFVFMAMLDAVLGLRRAVDSETDRIARNEAARDFMKQNLD